MQQQNSSNKEQVNIVLRLEETEEERGRGMGVAGAVKLKTGELFEQHLRQSLADLEAKESQEAENKIERAKNKTELNRIVVKALYQPATYLTYQLSYDADEVKFKCTADEVKLGKLIGEAVGKEVGGNKLRLSLAGITMWIIKKATKLNREQIQTVNEEVTRRVAHTVGNDLVRQQRQNLIDICQSFLPKMKQLQVEQGRADAMKMGEKSNRVVVEAHPQRPGLV